MPPLSVGVESGHGGDSKYAMYPPDGERNCMPSRAGFDSPPRIKETSEARTIINYLT